jgi:hypothetical protein
MEPKRKRGSNFKVKIRSGVKELPTVLWKIRVTSDGLQARKNGSHDILRASWRTILGILLVHQK